MRCSRRERWKCSLSPAAVLAALPVVVGSPEAQREAVVQVALFIPI